MFQIWEDKGKHFNKEKGILKIPKNGLYNLKLRGEVAELGEIGLYVFTVNNQDCQRDKSLCGMNLSEKNSFQTEEREIPFQEGECLAVFGRCWSDKPSIKQIALEISTVNHIE